MYYEMQRVVTTTSHTAVLNITIDHTSKKLSMSHILIF